MNSKFKIAILATILSTLIAPVGVTAQANETLPPTLQSQTRQLADYFFEGVHPTHGDVRFHLVRVASSTFNDTTHTTVILRAEDDTRPTGFLTINAPLRIFQGMVGRTHPLFWDEGFRALVPGSDDIPILPQSGINPHEVPAMFFEGVGYREITDEVVLELREMVRSQAQYILRTTYGRTNATVSLHNGWSNAAAHFYYYQEAHPEHPSIRYGDNNRAATGSNYRSRALFIALHDQPLTSARGTHGRLVSPSSLDIQHQAITLAHHADRYLGFEGGNVANIGLGLRFIPHRNEFITGIVFSNHQPRHAPRSNVQMPPVPVMIPAIERVNTSSVTNNQTQQTQQSTVGGQVNLTAASSIRGLGRDSAPRVSLPFAGSHTVGDTVEISASIASADFEFYRWDILGHSTGSGTIADASNPVTTIQLDTAGRVSVQATFQRVGSN